MLKIHKGEDLSKNCTISLNLDRMAIPQSFFKLNISFVMYSTRNLNIQSDKKYSAQHQSCCGMVSTRPHLSYSLRLENTALSSNIHHILRKV